MALAFCTTALISLKLGGLILNSSLGAADHTRPAGSLYLDQNMFSSGGSPAVLSALKGNLILVAGRVVLQTEMGLYRSLPSSFSFDFISSLRILLCSMLSVSPSHHAKVPAALFSLFLSLISCFLKFFFCFRRASISRCLLLFLGSLLA